MAPGQKGKRLKGKKRRETNYKEDHKEKQEIGITEDWRETEIATSLGSEILHSSQ